MKIKLKNNSVVILAELHNPTLISDKFLLDTKIINDISELNKDNYLLTPVIAQVQFYDGSNLLLDQTRLEITSPNENTVINKAISYISSLNYIKCTGLGINFDYNINEYDFESFFQNFSKLVSKSESSVNSINLKFIHHSNNCFVTVSYLDAQTGFIKFNFDYKFSLVPFKDLNLDLGQEWKQNKEISINFINNIIS